MAFLFTLRIFFHKSAERKFAKEIILSYSDYRNGDANMSTFQALQEGYNRYKQKSTQREHC